MAELEITSIDPNTADVETLCRLPGIGPVMAQRIVDARPFESAEALTRVSGIGPIILQRVRPFLALSPAEVRLPAAEPATLEANVGQVEAGYLAPSDGDGVETRGLFYPTYDVETDEVIEAKAAPIGDLPGQETDRAEEEPAGAVEREVWEAEEEPGEAIPSEESAMALPKEKSSGAPESAPTPVPLIHRPPVTRARLLWAVIASGFLALVLAVALSLGILATLNGNQLQYVLPSQLGAMGVRVEGLEARAGTLSQDVESLRTRLNNLEALTGRVSAVEDAAQQLRTDVDATTGQVKELSQELRDLQGEVTNLSEQVDSLETEMETVRSQAARFQSFFDGLQELLNTVFQPEGSTP